MFQAWNIVEITMFQPGLLLFYDVPVLNIVPIFTMFQFLTSCKVPRGWPPQQSGWWQIAEMTNWQWGPRGPTAKTRVAPPSSRGWQGAVNHDLKLRP